MSAVQPVPSFALPAPRWRQARRWLLCGAALAALELAIAAAFWAWQGVPALRVAQSLAAWWIGRAAYDGGLAAALLGYALYALLFAALVAGYQLAARRHPVLQRRPLLCGALYGVAAYVLVLEILVPTLAVYAAGSARWDWRLACVAAYALCAGWGSALGARLRPTLR